MMTEKQVAKAGLIQGAIDGIYTVRYLAKRLGVSERRIKQLKKAVREQGAVSVIHGNSGRHPKNYTEAALRERIVQLKQNNEAYREANFTHFRELLEEREAIIIGYRSLHRILTEAGIKSKKTHTAGKRFKRRPRRDRMGELLQVDATPYDWFDCGAQQAALQAAARFYRRRDRQGNRALFMRKRMYAPAISRCYVRR